MNKCKRSRLLFDDAFFGELSAEEQSVLDSHLEHCPQCRGEFQQNNVLLSRIAQKGTDGESHEPRPQFWDNYTANLHRRMVSEGILTGEDSGEQTVQQAGDQLLTKPPWIKELRWQISGWFTGLSIPGWALQGAAAAVILMVGIFIGRQFFAPGISPDSIPGPGNQHQASQQDMLRRTGNFIDRSRVILLAIENFDPETESAGAINLPYQQEISRGLVRQAVALKQELNDSRQRRLSELVTQLEVILLQIANIDSGSEMETLRLVKGDRYIRGILYKIRINDLRRSTHKLNKGKTI